MVWRLDRLGRPLKYLIEFIYKLEVKGIYFKSIQESIDMTTSSDKLLFHIFGALAEFERNLIKERSKAGLDAARARGRLGGRSKRLNTNKRLLLVEMVGISKPTLYKYLQEKVS